MPQSVGERVRARIAELQTNSAEVARRAGLERTFVHDLISGRKKTVTAEALISLALALHCLPEELVGKAGAIPRDGTGDIDIVGIVEANVWRGSPPRNLGAISSFNDGNPNARAFVVRGDEASPIGIKDGSALIVDMSGRGRAGDIVVVERTRDDLKEFSLRKVIDAEGQLMLAAPNGSADGLLPVPSGQPGETIRIVGRVQRAVLLFSNAVS